jgi:hypothetical protein
MAQAESADSTIALASRLCARAIYHDLNRSNGSIDRSVLMTARGVPAARLRPAVVPILQAAEARFTIARAAAERGADPYR